MGFNPTLISTAINAVTRRVGSHMAGNAGAALMNRMTPQRNRAGQTAAQYGESLDERMAGAGGRYSAGQTDQNMPIMGGQQQSPYGGGYSPGVMSLNQVNSESQIVQKLDTSIQVLERIGISVDQIKFYLSEFMAENKRGGSNTGGIAGANQLAGQQQPGILSGILSGLAGMLGMSALGNALKPKTPKPPNPTSAERTAARNAARGTRSAGQNAARAAAAEARGAQILSAEARAASAAAARSTTAGLAVRGVGGAILRRGVPILGAALAANDEFQESGNAGRAGAVGLGGWGGMAAGAAMGATLGSVVPGAGTLIGGVVGGAIGGIAGTSFGRGVYDSFANPGGLGNNLWRGAQGLWNSVTGNNSAPGVTGGKDKEIKFEAKNITFTGTVVFSGGVAGLSAGPTSTSPTSPTPPAGSIGHSGQRPGTEGRTRSAVPEMERPRGETGSARQRRDEDRRDGMIDIVLLDQISRGEGTEVSHYNRLASSQGGQRITSAYDAEVYHGKHSGTHKPISQMTIREIFALMRQMVNQQKRAGIPENKRSSALGKYQINRKTLLDMLKPPPLGMALSEDTIFSESIQDRIAMHLLNYGDSRGNNGLDELRAGTATAEEFQNGTLARRWASFPKTSGRSAYGQRVGAENVADIIEAARTRPEGSTAGPRTPDPIGTPAGVSSQGQALLDRFNSDVRNITAIANGVPPPPPQAGVQSPARAAASDGWVIPCSGRISSRFGGRRHPVTGVWQKSHGAIDIAAPNGSPVVAARGGRLTQHRGGAAGNHVIIDHGGGWVSAYCHLSKFSTENDITVVTGQLIGEVGSTGRSSGNHLHFKIRHNGTPVDPETVIPALKAANVIGGVASSASAITPRSVTTSTSGANGSGGAPARSDSGETMASGANGGAPLVGSGDAIGGDMPSRTEAERRQRWDDYTSHRRSFSSFRPPIIPASDLRPGPDGFTGVGVRANDDGFRSVGARPTRPAASIQPPGSSQYATPAQRRLLAAAQPATRTAMGVGATPSATRTRPRTSVRAPSMMWWLSTFAPSGTGAALRGIASTRP